MVDRSASHEPAHVLRFTSSNPVAKKAEAVAIDRKGNEFQIIKGAPTAVGSVAPMTRRAKPSWRPLPLPGIECLQSRTALEQA